MYILWFSAM